MVTQIMSEKIFAWAFFWRLMCLNHKAKSSTENKVLITVIMIPTLTVIMKITLYPCFQINIIELT
jgi:hypothetical protein